WRQQLVGSVRSELQVTVQPGSVTLLALHEDSERPLVIGTDRHLLMGALELEGVQWDAARKIISGVSRGPIGSSHTVSIFVPGQHPWTWGGYVLYRDYGDYSAKLMQENVVQLQVRFEKTESVEWAFDVGQFFQ